MRISDWSSDVCSSDLDLGRRGRDVRTYVHALENWVIAALSRIGIAAYPVPDRIGIWTRDGGEEAKIGAIGVRVRKWVTLHGFSVNITRSEERRDGKECVSTCRSRWTPYL